MSTNRWMDKENVVYTRNGISWSLKKEGPPVMRYNMDESEEYCAKQNKPVTKDKYCTIEPIWSSSYS